MSENDVIDLLTRRHAEIQDAFTDVQSSTGGDRQRAFDRLRRLLAVHETAEEEVVHPYARRVADDGKATVDARLAEERSAKEILAALDALGPDGPGFMERLHELRAAVTEHARHEEDEEFPRLRAATTPEERRALAAAVRAAEATAPTRPHPGVESGVANLVAGPVASVIDRTKDALRARRA
ncbi:hemerythrin domain-containing protein [Actinomadura flavalba]|uniref:hemerythrin domain-containing protein n=1 Tax=Actinomadura flavalba TaxID=1120938 RepID=UPI0003722DA6|nr:hemerythrin domain-containing protein [Actinomadura flavalba]